jgi:hypothetical protein
MKSKTLRFSSPVASEVLPDRLKITIRQITPIYISGSLLPPVASEA